MRFRRWPGRNSSGPVPGRPVRNPVAWLRIVVAAIIGSLLLTALYVWGLQDYVAQRRTVRDAQYQRTQQDLDRQRERVAQLEGDQKAAEQRLEELERRAGLTPAAGSPDGSGGSKPRPGSSATIRRTSAQTTPPRPGPTAAPSPAGPPRRTPSPMPPPSPVDPAGDSPLLCLPLLGCVL